MAAYASTTTIDTAKAERISSNLWMLTGICDVTNYNTTLVEIKGITRYFVSGRTFSVLGGLSDNGHLLIWNRTSKAFKAYRTALGTTAGNITIVGGQAAGAALQIEPDTAAGVLGKTAATTRAIPIATLFTAAPTVAAAALAEVASDVDVGEVQFVAFGIGRV